MGIQSKYILTPILLFLILCINRHCNTNNSSNKRDSNNAIVGNSNSAIVRNSNNACLVGIQYSTTDLIGTQGIGDGINDTVD